MSSWLSLMHFAAKQDLTCKCVEHSPNPLSSSRACSARPFRGPRGLPGFPAVAMRLRRLFGSRGGAGRQAVLFAPDINA